MVLAAAYAVAGTVYLSRYTLRRVLMALKTTGTVKKTVARVKSAAKTATKRPAAKKPADDGIPNVTLSRIGARTYVEPWMTPAVKRIRTEYYKKLVDEINAALRAAIERFKAEPKAQWAFHLHHEALIEPVRGDNGETGLKGALERIRYVASSKDADELLDRLVVMRPIPQAKIDEALAKTKTTEEPKVEPPKRITRKDVQALGEITDQKQRAFDAFDQKAATERARAELATAWEKFYLDSSRYTSYGYRTTYKPGTQEALEDLKAKAEAWVATAKTVPDPAVVAAAKAELEAARLAYQRLDREYYAEQTRIEQERYKAQKLGDRPADMTEDQVWALHAELCDPSCPFTKSHHSVIKKK